MRTGIIVPCYNEAQRMNVSKFVDFILSEEMYHLCFVNDGSTDDTLFVLESIQQHCPERVSVIDVKVNAGKASAVRSGARYLYSQTEISYIGFIDADLSTDFRDFKKLVETLEGEKNLQMVYGSRRKGGDIRRNISRKIMSDIIKRMIYFIHRLPIEDTQCGAKVFKRQVIPIVYGQAFMTRWLFDIEIFVRLKKEYGPAGVMATAREQALERWVHVEDSKLGIRDSLMIPFRLLQIWLAYSFTGLFFRDYASDSLG